MLSIPAVLALFAAMVLGRARKLLLGVILLDIPFQLDIHLAFRNDVAGRGAVEGLNVSATTLALVGLYALWLAESLAKRPGTRSRRGLRTSLPLALYLESHLPIQTWLRRAGPS